MLEWVRDKLGMNDLLQRMDELENRVEILEDHVERSLERFGAYQHRTDQELIRMGQEINDMLFSLDALIKNQEHQFAIDRALRLRRRLRNHKTRIANALSA